VDEPGGLGGEEERGIGEACQCESSRRAIAKRKKIPARHHAGGGFKVEEEQRQQEGEERVAVVREGSMLEQAVGEAEEETGGEELVRGGAVEGAGG
jgi:hypothetical protein